jgi:hypothetical protein
MKNAAAFAYKDGANVHLLQRRLLPGKIMLCPVCSVHKTKPLISFESKKKCKLNKTAETLAPTAVSQECT